MIKFQNDQEFTKLKSCYIFFSFLNFERKSENFERKQNVGRRSVTFYVQQIQ